MEVSKRGGRRPGAGRKKTPSKQLRDAIDGIDVEGIVKNLRDWAKGKEVICPHCLKNTGAHTADTVALQSAIELLNRRLGKVPQSVQLDITETIQLDADQCNALIERFRIAQRALLTEGECDIIDAEVTYVQEQE